jgi:hypothetical protein
MYVCMYVIGLCMVEMVVKVRKLLGKNNFILTSTTLLCIFIKKILCCEE